jgi:hypothetical protein
MERDSDREQRLFVIEYEAEQTTCRDRDWRGEPREGIREEPEEAVGQTEETGGTREIGPGGDQHETRWVPNYPTSHSQPAPQTYETPYEPPVDATSHNDDLIDRVDSPNHTGRYQLPTPTAHPELERHAYEGYGIADEHAVVASSDDDEGDDVYNRGDPPPARFHTMNDHGPYTTLFDGHEHKGGASAEPDHDTMIEQLERELFASGNMGVSWAAEMDNMGLHGEYYTLASYPNPPPAPPPVLPSPTCWDPPPPPTPVYRPPQTPFPPPHAWYDPPQTHHKPRRAPFHPRPFPTSRRRIPSRNRTGHVTAKRPVRNRERPRSNEDGLLQYVPPALRGEDWTPRRSHLPQTRSAKDWRDPPPHKNLPQSPPRPSDSPDWRAPSPNRPASFRSPSPPPQSPPSSPVHSTHTPKMLPIPQPPQAEFQAIPKLFSIIKTASNTLQSILRLAEKLIRQVNAERQLAHKPQKIIWSSRVDALGNLGCSQPPKFPSWRGAPVTGSPEVSGSIA